MTRTTPPRPLDIAALFPALAPLARTATRLHPRPGTPSPHDSSVGGPLLWPASEPWPHCDGPHELDGVNPVVSPANVRLTRQLSAAGRVRRLTTQERETLARIHARPETPITTLPGSQPYDGSIAMLPVAQLYARDVPGMTAPAGTDLLQVLWCPFDHPDDVEYMPKTALYWRSTDMVTDILTDPPEPTAVQFTGYLPEPCTISPERVTEYPALLELDAGLRQQLEQWAADRLGVEQDDIADGEVDHPYVFDLSVAPGWKIGGWIGWGLNDPDTAPCSSCGTPTEPLLTIAGGEWQSGGDSWITDEDRAADISSSSPAYLAKPSGIEIGRGYSLIIRACPTSPDHPHVQLMQ
ncbi:hypothetical protein AB0L57_22710 [Nocardia sp. NPDC052254]|uniref:hypothetical protein n=1 Tax=Nocardia sp. NPDC052254 TaxID=3155681 RepID=UPI0034331DCF